MNKGLFLIFIFLISFTFTKKTWAEDNLIDPFLPKSSPQLKTVITSLEVTPSKIPAGKRTILTLLGRVPLGSHIYSVLPQGEHAPSPTYIKISSRQLYPVGELKESTPVMAYDEAYGVVLKVHKNQFYLQQEYQTFPFAKPGKHYMKGKLIYQICNNRICSLPLKESFNFTFEVTAL